LEVEVFPKDNLLFVVFDFSLVLDDLLEKQSA